MAIAYTSDFVEYGSCEIEPGSDSSISLSPFKISGADQRAGPTILLLVNSVLSNKNTCPQSAIHAVRSPLTRMFDLNNQLISIIVYVDQWHTARRSPCTVSFLCKNSRPRKASMIWKFIQLAMKTWAEDYELRVSILGPLSLSFWTAFPSIPKCCHFHNILSLGPVNDYVCSQALSSRGHYRFGVASTFASHLRESISFDIRIPSQSGNSDRHTSLKASTAVVLYEGSPRNTFTAQTWETYEKYANINIELDSLGPTCTPHEP